jgi:hypothetical protein
LKDPPWKKCRNQAVTRGKRSIQVLSGMELESEMMEDEEE